jgi:uncharacterized protein YfiM (DUF2279 family)
MLARSRFAAAFLAGALLAAPPALRAAEPADPWLGEDKIRHGAVSMVLAAEAYGFAAEITASPWERAAAGFGVSVGLGLAKEVADLAGAGDASYRDVVWNVAGALLGAGIVLAMDVLTGAPRAPPPPAEPAGPHPRGGPDSRSAACPCEPR